MVVVGVVEVVVVVLLRVLRVIIAEAQIKDGKIPYLVSDLGPEVERD